MCKALEGPEAAYQVRVRVRVRVRVLTLTLTLTCSTNGASSRADSATARLGGQRADERASARPRSSHRTWWGRGRVRVS